MSSGELSYPNLVGCKVVMKSSSSSSKPPVQLPKDCWDAAKISIAPLYSFHLEKSVLKKKEERDVDSTISSTGSRDELERAMLVKMKSVTNASEDVCISMLESNGYDLKSSIETYFQSR